MQTEYFIKLNKEYILNNVLDIIKSNPFVFHNNKYYISYLVRNIFNKSKLNKRKIFQNILQYNLIQDEEFNYLQTLFQEDTYYKYLLVKHLIQ